MPEDVWGSEGIAHLQLDPQYPLDRRMVGHQSRSGHSKGKDIPVTGHGGQ
jgi:hypothetical protein